MAGSLSLSYLSMRFVQVVVMLAGAWFAVDNSPQVSASGQLPSASYWRGADARQST